MSPDPSFIQIHCFAVLSEATLEGPGDEVRTRIKPLGTKYDGILTGSDTIWGLDRSPTNNDYFMSLAKSWRRGT